MEIKKKCSPGPTKLGILLTLLGVARCFSFTI